MRTVKRIQVVILSLLEQHFSLSPWRQLSTTMMDKYDWRWIYIILWKSLDRSKSHICWTRVVISLSFNSTFWPIFRLHMSRLMLYFALDFWEACCSGQFCRLLATESQPLFDRSQTWKRWWRHRSHVWLEHRNDGKTGNKADVPPRANLVRCKVEVVPESGAARL